VLPPRLGRSLLPRRRGCAPKAPRCGEGSRQPLLPLSPTFPCAQIARRRPEPHLTAGRRLRPLLPLPEPLDALLASLSCSHAKLEPKPYPKMHLLVIPASCRRLPPLPLTADAQRHRPMQSAAPQPFDPDLTG
jgi:hypothetical protein